MKERFRFRRITASDRPRYQARLEALERLATYPLGAKDSFQISHGENYFAFFERMGELHYHAALHVTGEAPEGERLAAVGAGVIRRVPLREGARPKRAWYLCDLKAHPDYRRRHLPLKMLSSAFWINYLRCARGYAISMNPGDGSPNPIVRLLAHFKWAPARLAGTLELYTLSMESMLACEDALREHRGPISYLTLAGKKDLILASTGAPAKLLHVQFGPCAEPGIARPQPEHIHTFCTPAGDPLSRRLRELGFAPDATASIISHRMPGCDWRFVLTSEI
jgi:hypothetical protein